MIGKLYNLALNGIDSAVYAFIGPFSVLYVFPQFFLRVERVYLDSMTVPPLVDAVGSVLMWVGAILAIWCGVLMALNKWGSVVPFFTPTVLITNGPYRLVRHPMMWALFLVLIGETLVFLSPAVLLWLILWIRFSYIYIGKHEDPFLLRHFGEAYKEYADRVPRWIPFSKPTPIK